MPRHRDVREADVNPRLSVDTETYNTIDMMRNALIRASIDRSEKVKAFRRLTEFASQSTS